MEHVSLYRRFRPNTFDKVIGQNHIVRTLINQIESGRVGHAYVFTGTRGTGKTTCAKIFARAVNCLHPVNGSPCGECEVCKALLDPSNIDIIEMDGASNNGVDEIRDLRENVQYPPVAGRYKVYIIDEAHMLTASAFNALLKTLEEPPAYVIFILATTEVSKFPQTILSRCLRFDFRLVAKDLLVQLLKDIFAEIKVPIDEKSLSLIASGGEGSVRDTLSLADMVLSYGGKEVRYEDTLEVLCATNFSYLHDLAEHILAGNCGGALKIADSLLSSGRNTLVADIIGYLMDLISVKNIPAYNVEGLSEEDMQLVVDQGNRYNNYRIVRVLDIFNSIESALKYTTQPKIFIESTVVRACELVTDLSNEGLMERISALEKTIEELKKGGITLVKSEVKTVTAPVQEKKEEKKVETKTEVVNKLLSNALNTDVELVFEDKMQVRDGDSQKAMDIWSKVVTKLEETDRFMLKMAVKSTEDIDCNINGGVFFLYTNDTAMLATVEQGDNHKFIQELVNTVSGEKYEFHCAQHTKQDTAVSRDDKITLDRLFNGEIKVVKK